jgi:hypothetical protein
MRSISSGGTMNAQEPGGLPTEPMFSKGFPSQTIEVSE